MPHYTILSIFISLALSFTDQDLRILRSNCDRLLYKLPYSINNFQVCRDKYALVRNCLDFYKADESLPFKGYACDLEHELGYTDRLPYRKHSKAYNWFKDNNRTEYSIPNGFVWNFQIFDDYQTLNQVCKIPHTEIILPPRTSTPGTNSPIDYTTGTTLRTSTPGTNSPIDYTTGTTLGTSVSSNNDANSKAVEDSTKLVTIVAGTCVVLVLIPIIAIAIAMIKGGK